MWKDSDFAAIFAAIDNALCVLRSDERDRDIDGIVVGDLLLAQESLRRIADGCCADV